MKKMLSLITLVAASLLVSNVQADCCTKEVKPVCTKMVKVQVPAKCETSCHKECPEGWQMNEENGMCEQDVTVTKCKRRVCDRDYTHRCPEGTVMNDAGQCEKIVTVCPIKECVKSYRCPEGTTAVGDRCEYTVTKTKCRRPNTVKTKSFFCPTGTEQKR